MNILEIELPRETRAYARPRIDGIALAGGSFSVLVLLGLLLALPAMASASNLFSGDQDDAPFEYIEARLLKFGEDPKPSDVLTP